MVPALNGERKMKNYEVTITNKFPSWNSAPETYFFKAKDRNDAIKQARRMMNASDYSFTTNGPLIYKAKSVN